MFNGDFADMSGEKYLDLQKSQNFISICKQKTEAPLGHKSVLTVHLSNGVSKQCENKRR